jgi:hypothetical protein
MLETILTAHIEQAIKGNFRIMSLLREVLNYRKIISPRM